MFLTFNNTNFTLLSTHSLTSYILFINHYNIFSTAASLKSGSLSRFMQVEAVGNLSVSAPEFWMQKGGSRSLKPSSGGLEQLVTNLSSALFWSSPSPVTTWTNQRSVFWSPW